MQNAKNERRNSDCTNYRGKGFKAGAQNNPLRLKEKHFISPIATMPGKSTKRRKCVRCLAMKKRKDTSYDCRKCDVALCLHPCFEVYHTRVHYDRVYLSASSSQVESDFHTEQRIRLSQVFRSSVLWSVSAKIMLKNSKLSILRFYF